jgi:hypothetical protein
MGEMLDAALTAYCAMKKTAAAGFSGNRTSDQTAVLTRRRMTKPIKPKPARINA